MAAQYRPSSKPQFPNRIAPAAREGSRACGFQSDAPGETAPVDTGLGETAERRHYLRLRDKAYEYLSRREYSLYELRSKLKRWDEMDQLDLLVEQLRNENSQSDLRFAEHLARVRYGAGKGPRVLEQEFNQHKIDPLIIEQVMAEFDGLWLESAQRASGIQLFTEDMTDSPIHHGKGERISTL